MYGIINFETFVVAGVLLNLTPGVDSMYILSRSISQGRVAGIFSALGILTGAFFHVLFATFGLSMILAKSSYAFDLVKYVGAIYLIYLGTKILFGAIIKEDNLDEIGPQFSHKKMYISGILTNLLNPKIALFFLAFLPQFVDSNNASNSTPIFILGSVFLITGTICCLALALFAARISTGFRKNQRVKVWLDIVTGGVFVSLGVKLALTEK